MKWTRANFSHKSLMAVALAFLLIWLLFFATWPAKPVKQCVVRRADGSQVVVKLWRADPVIGLPFFDEPGRWVQYNDGWCRLHPSHAFGYGVGPILVSPDRTCLLVSRRFEGGLSRGVRIDLESGAMTEIHTDIGSLEAKGWQATKWRAFSMPDSGKSPTTLNLED